MDTTRKPLDYYLGLQYPLNLLADPDGGYVVVFPDLPGCLTQVETLDEFASMAEEARALWIETEFESGHDIPLPSYPEEYSGRFNLRLPRSLHRSLAETAEREGVSLNQHVMQLLARGDSQVRLERRIDQLFKQVELPALRRGAERDQVAAKTSTGAPRRTGQRARRSSAARG